MDTLNFLTQAISLGVVAGLKPTAEQAVKDAYAGLKGLLTRKYKISLDGLEQKSESKTQLDAVTENLSDSKVMEDPEIINWAQALIEAVYKYDPVSAQTIGIRLEDLNVAGSLILKSITADGNAIGVEVKKADITRDVNISDVHAHGSSPTPKA